jgi:predicted nucleic acid-binding protein
VRTAIDTNILSAILSNEPSAGALTELLTEAQAIGGLVISPVVWTELRAHPNASESFLKEFLSDVGIDVDFGLEAKVWHEAARRFTRYAERRRKSQHGNPKRLLADFLVGSHALVHADRLISRDHARYRRDFPELSLI